MLKSILKSEIEKTAEELFGAGIDFEIKKDEKFGDYSTNLAMVAGGNSRQNAEKISAELSKSKILNQIVFKIEIAGPGFINIHLKPEAVQKELEIILRAKDKWGRPGKAEKKRVVIDYSAPNIAKPMNIGHLRSTIIGQALYNIFKFCGWKVIGDNHLGDWGTQFGVLISAYKKSNLKNKKDIKVGDLVSLYIDYSQKMKENSEMENEARLETKKLQDGDKENRKIWKLFYKITMEELKKTYKILDAHFDYYLGESFYQPMLGEMVKEALEKGIAEKSEGAVVIFLSESQPPFIIKKSDDAYLYSTTDLATIKYREKKFKPNLILYVVANEQALHFEQLFKAAQLFGLNKEVKMAHVKFGLILDEDRKKFSTREGRIIPLDEVIREGIARARKVIEEKQPGLKEKEKEKIAEAVGVGALKYNDLSQNRFSDITFKWEKMLSMEGNSAPYLQYTYARLRSILEKKKLSRFDPSHLKEKEELNLILLLEEFPDVLEEITKNYLPNYLADYLFELAREANTFYHALPVLRAERGVGEARLALISAVCNTLKTGLNLLGIKTLERM